LISKLVHISSGTPAPLVTDRPYFFIALTAMVIGTQLFLTGFLAELFARQSQDRNDYKIEEEL
jgi:putative glycosyltransferase